jgi:hypothetical protein
VAAGWDCPLLWRDVSTCLAPGYCAPFVSQAAGILLCAFWSPDLRAEHSTSAQGTLSDLGHVTPSQPRLPLDAPGMARHLRLVHGGLVPRRHVFGARTVNHGTFSSGLPCYSLLSRVQAARAAAWSEMWVPGVTFSLPLRTRLSNTYHFAAELRREAATAP